MQNAFFPLRLIKKYVFSHPFLFSLRSHTVNENINGLETHTAVLANPLVSTSVSQLDSLFSTHFGTSPTRQKPGTSAVQFFINYVQNTYATPEQANVVLDALVDYVIHMQTQQASMDEGGKKAIVPHNYVRSNLKGALLARTLNSVQGDIRELFGKLSRLKLSSEKNDVYTHLKGLEGSVPCKPALCAVRNLTGLLEYIVCTSRDADLFQDGPTLWLVFEWLTLFYGGEEKAGSALAIMFTYACFLRHQHNKFLKNKMTKNHALKMTIPNPTELLDFLSSVPGGHVFIFEPLLNDHDVLDNLTLEMLRKTIDERTEFDENDSKLWGMWYICSFFKMHRPLTVARHMSSYRCVNQTSVRVLSRWQYLNLCAFLLRENLAQHEDHAFFDTFVGYCGCCYNDSKRPTRLVLNVYLSTEEANRMKVLCESEGKMTIHKAGAHYIICGISPTSMFYPTLIKYSWENENPQKRLTYTFEYNKDIEAYHLQITIPLPSSHGMMHAALAAARATPHAYSGNLLEEKSKLPPSEESAFIIAESDSVIVVNKPRGMPTMRHSLATFQSAEDYIANSSNWDAPIDIVTWVVRRRPNQENVYRNGVCQRLDKCTSGVLVFAKSSSMLLKLNYEFGFAYQKVNRDFSRVGPNWMGIRLNAGNGHNSVILSEYTSTETTETYHHKKYLALCRVVGEQPTEGAIAEQIYSSRTGARSIVIRTDYRILALFPKHSRIALVEATLFQGKRHQVRRHLRQIGLPLLGDISYGGAPLASPSVAIAGQGAALHAWKVTIEHQQAGLNEWVQEVESANTNVEQNDEQAFKYAFDGAVKIFVNQYSDGARRKFVTFTSPVPQYMRNFINELQSVEEDVMSGGKSGEKYYNDLLS